MKNSRYWQSCVFQCFGRDSGFFHSDSGAVSLGAVFAFALWGVVVFGGTIAMMRYANIPGNSGSAPATWPSQSQISLNAHRPTLIMFAHPRCPCTRASLGELDVLLAKCRDRISANVVFLKADDTVTNWEKTDLWSKASSMPGVRVYSDNAGMEARRFHAETSGTTLLYDPSGVLRFQGGITMSRGHAGDNPGRTALQELALEGRSSRAATPVFGCSMFDAECRKGSSQCKP